MEKLNIDDIKNMRGFSALTQSEARLEEKLLNNINDLNGKKAIGFNKTRKEVLQNEFDAEALQTAVELALDVEEKKVPCSPLVKSIAKQLCERIFRDFVPMDMVPTFKKGFVNVVRNCDNRVEDAVNLLKNYFKSDTVVPVAVAYREFLEEIEEGKVLYYEPRKRVSE